MSSTSMIEFNILLNPTDTMPMLSPSQEDLPPPYLCHPLFPQMIGASPTQLRYKIKKCIILGHHIRLCVNAANDD